ncbi:MAG: Fic family protein [Candidatus Diapherotrites archaeon]|nr:Fic family protein [Candidatus Diapherotrites archaeon]
MADLIERRVKGKTYFYLEKNIRLGQNRWKRVSVYLGRKKPPGKELGKKKKELEKKARKALASIYAEKLGRFRFSFLSREELAEAERVRENFLERFGKLSEKKKGEFNKNQALEFVYTTLRTEGVEVDFGDVETAYTVLQKEKGAFVLDKKVIISSAMIAGFNFLPKIRMTERDVLRLHSIIMSSFDSKSPGQLRDDQRIIARFNPKTLQSEEIHYRPPGPAKAREEFSRFFDWFEQNKDIHPLELAPLVHLKIYLIHPFKDGNKRICRLLFNKVLQENNYSIVNISKKTQDYFEALIKSVETGNEKHFVKFCHKAFLAQVKNKRL